MSAVTPIVLDFEAERDRDSTSFDRADPPAALIEQQHQHAWTVSLPDVYGTPVEIQPVDRNPETAEADHYDDPERARADGGQGARR